MKQFKQFNCVLDVITYVWYIASIVYWFERFTGVSKPAIIHCGIRVFFIESGFEKMIEAWLKCTIDKGMFPGELGISFEDAHGQIVSLYCSERFIDKAQSALLVTVLRKSEKSSTVRLPDQSFNGTTVAEVSSDNLKEVMQVA